MNAQGPKVTVVVLSWNGKDYLERCLSSILKQTYRNYEVLFVDNGSSDGSADLVRSNFPGVSILALNPNCGFAKGNNIGIEKVLKNDDVRYVLLLSIDTYVDVNFIAELVSVAESENGIGSCQPRMLSSDDPHIINAVGLTLGKKGGAIQLGYGKEDTDEFCQIREVFGANAGAALYRSDMLRQIGLFDEDFFAYYEDVDLALRARLAGWKCVYSPKALVYHKHSVTYGKQSPFKEYVLTRNSYYYVIKDLPADIVFWFLLKRLRNVVGLMVRMMIRRMLFNKNEHDMNASRLKAHIHAIRNIHKMFGKRKEIQSKKTISNEELKRWFI